MLKELSDHLSSWRMRVLEWLVVIAAVAVLVPPLQPATLATATGTSSSPDAIRQ